MEGAALCREHVEQFLAEMRRLLGSGHPFINVRGIVPVQVGIDLLGRQVEHVALRYLGLAAWREDANAVEPRVVALTRDVPDVPVERQKAEVVGRADVALELVEWMVELDDDDEEGDELDLRVRGELG